MALTVDNLSVSLQGKPVLEQTNFSAAVGDITAICGANGAGKSTLLKAISRDIPIDAGQICFHDVSIQSLSAKAMARKRAVMPQQVDIQFHFTVEEVIDMGLHLTPSPKERRYIVNEVAGLLDLGGLLSVSYLSLSGGQKQRVQLARVIGQILQNGLTEPRYLLLDECTSAMDIAMVNQVFLVLKTLINRYSHYLSVVAVVHDLNIASLYADRIVFVHNKHCAYAGRPEELLTETIIDEVFNTPVNIMTHPQTASPLVVPKVLHA